MNFYNLKYYFYRLAGRLRRVFFMALPENEEDCRKSRNAFITTEIANQTMQQFVGGTFLAAALSYLKLSDGMIGMVMSVTTLSTVFNLLIMNYVQQLGKRKLFVCFLILQKIWLSFMYFIPLFHWRTGTKAFWFILFLTVGQICTQISTPAINDWIGDLVPPETRGEYFARKDAVAVFVVIVSMFLMGFVFDHFYENDHYYSYPVIGIAIFLLVIINLAGFLSMKEPRGYLCDPEGHEMHGALLRRHKNTNGSTASGQHVFFDCMAALKNREFRAVLFMTCMWNMAFYIAQPFNNSYQIKELGLSFTYIMTVSLGANMIRVLLTPFIGRKADRIGMANMLILILILYTAGYFFMMLAVPGAGRIMYILSVILSSISWCFINTGLLCIQFEFLDRKLRMLQFALLMAVSGVVGFLVSAAGGRLVDFLQKHPPVLFGRSLYAQQVMNFLGILMTAAVILYLYVKIRKMEESRKDEIRE